MTFLGINCIKNANTFVPLQQQTTYIHISYLGFLLISKARLETSRAIFYCDDSQINAVAMINDFFINFWYQIFADRIRGFTE